LLRLSIEVELPVSRNYRSSPKKDILFFGLIFDPIRALQLLQNTSRIKANGLVVVENQIFLFWPNI
jgi:hypothetical protein